MVEQANQVECKSITSRRPQFYKASIRHVLFLLIMLDNKEHLQDFNIPLWEKKGKRKKNKETIVFVAEKNQETIVFVAEMHGIT